MTAAIGELLIRRANKILLPPPEGDGPVADSMMAALNVNLRWAARSIGTLLLISEI